MADNNKKPVRMTIKKWIAVLVKGLLAVVVMAFLGSESLNFFSWVFSADQWYMAYTGFGLTMGAMLAYFYLFLNEADTSLKKTVALLMMAVGIFGELLTAGFGMQINADASLAQGDLDFMILAVRLLMFAHAIALIAYSAGDKIIQAFKDDDGDGVPNFADRNDNRQHNQNNQPRPQQQNGQRQQYPVMENSAVVNSAIAEGVKFENPTPRP